MKREQFKEAFIQEQKWARGLNTMTMASFNSLTKGYFKDLSLNTILSSLRGVETPDDILPMLDRLIQYVKAKEFVNEIMSMEITMSAQGETIEVDEVVVEERLVDKYIRELTKN